MAPVPERDVRQRMDAFALAREKKGFGAPGSSRGYTAIRAVGKGEFGMALLVQDKAGNLRVMKTVDISSLGHRQRRDAVEEVTVLSSLKHPYIVRYRESFIDGGTLAIVMDFAEGGDLYRKIDRARKDDRPFSEPQIVRWFTQAALGLTYLHGRNVMHRDVKSQNLFLTKHQSVRIGDFGISKVLRENSGPLRDREMKGTPYYLSPEICREALYTFACDVWALGCVLHEMAALRVPFQAQSLALLIQKITRAGPAPVIPSTFSKELRRLGTELLCHDHSKRPSAAEILQRPIIQTEMRRMLSDGEDASASSSKSSCVDAQSSADPETTGSGTATPAVESTTSASGDLGGVVVAGSGAAAVAAQRSQIHRTGSAPSLPMQQRRGSGLGSSSTSIGNAQPRSPKRTSATSPKRSSSQALVTKAPKRWSARDLFSAKANLAEKFGGRLQSRPSSAVKVAGTSAPIGGSTSLVDLTAVAAATDAEDAAAAAAATGTTTGTATADQGGLQTRPSAARPPLARPASAVVSPASRAASLGSTATRQRPTTAKPLGAGARFSSCGAQDRCAAGFPSRAGSASCWSGQGGAAFVGSTALARVF